MRFSEAPRDDSDGEDTALLNATPIAQKRMIRESETKKIPKLGPIATGFTLFKGFVCTGILYMPLSFVNGGYIFSVVALIFALVLTLYCIKLILEVRDKLGGSLSFSDIGLKTYGKTGKFLVDVSMFGSQTGFTCAYIYFIAS